MIGIYKITNPLGQVYVGQSSNLRRRMQEHTRLKYKRSRKLYESLIKYGLIGHIFEIIEECNLCDLNDRERFWQDSYDVLGDNGLNLRLNKAKDKPGVVSMESESIRVNTRQKNNIKKYNKPFKSNKSNKPITRKYSGENHKSSKLVLDKSTGIFFTSCREAADSYNIYRCYLRMMLSGHTKNRTNLIYV